MNALAVEQYAQALKSGQKYCREAEAQRRDPYPAVLDRLIRENEILRQEDLGLVNVPSELIVGTKTEGRTCALAGNFMPLLEMDTEFAAKWIALCDAHLSDEGIRDPIKCYEYLGKFYVQEGNKRVSVLRSFDAPTVPGLVTRLLPPAGDSEERKIYDEFVAFYRLSGQYGVNFRHTGGYDRLQAALGMEKDHVWTEEERRSFRAGYARFRSSFGKISRPGVEATAAEALLTWLEVFSFADIKELPAAELEKKLTQLLPEIRVQEEEKPIEISTRPAEKEKNLVSKIISAAISEHVSVAFIYAFPTEKSAWTLAHDKGRQALEIKLGSKVNVRTCLVLDRDYAGAMEQAVEDGARVIFATTPPMIDACRQIAAKYKNVKVLNCSLSQPYPGVRSYYSRIYETKFIAGALAGAMSDGDLLGYVANYPIFGTPAGVNAFALGAQMTNPRARVKLVWSCLPGDPQAALRESGITVISNRDAGTPGTEHRALDYGLYRCGPDGSFQSLALPCWNWGAMYEKIVLSVLNGAWEEGGGKAINYWWGMSSGVIDIKLSDGLPSGVRKLGEILKAKLSEGSLDPFSTRIVDQNGVLRCEGDGSLPPDEIMSMDWLCENVDGEIPAFEELLPRSQGLVRLLGVYRDQLEPKKVEKQL